MTFRQALGLTWMTSAGSYLVAWFPFMAEVTSAETGGEVAFWWASLFLVVGATVGGGYVIGWADLLGDD